MKRGLAVALSLALALAPVEARADHEGALVLVALALVVGEVVVVGGSLTTSIGNLAQVGRERPSMGWTIAGFVLGGIATLWGGAWTLVTGANAGDGGDSDVLFWFFSLTPLVLGLASLGLSAMNVARRARAEPDEEALPVEPEEEEWTLTPLLIPARDGVAPGAGAAIAF
jgi:hypothetical protein